MCTYIYIYIERERESNGNHNNNNNNNNNNNKLYIYIYKIWEVSLGIRLLGTTFWCGSSNPQAATAQRRLVERNRISQSADPS